MREAENFQLMRQIYGTKVKNEILRPKQRTMILKASCLYHYHDINITHDFMHQNYNANVFSIV